jgi:hypothetical protein
MRAIPTAASLIGIALFAPAAFAAGVPVCSEIAAGLTGSAGIKSASSAIIPASGPNVAYCQVNILYGVNEDQNINIRLGLPLNSRDGGAGGIEGAWNGRTQGVGGGGCSGTLSVTAPVNAGYVGSGTDGGHSGAANNCEPAVNPDGTYNVQYIQDWSRNALKQQILFSKAVATTYYGGAPKYNYWNGCSTGGRQGYLLAQELPQELDGILANAPAIYWTRFQTAQMWGQIVMKDLAGGVIPTAKQNFAASKATAACDALDGVSDGIIDDPRVCTYSAANDPTAICAANGGTSADASCLTPEQAQAMDKIWDGPRNASGVKVWFHSEPGSGTTVWNGPNPFALGVTQFHWDEADRNFDWRNVTMFGAAGTDSYADIAFDGSTNPLDPAVNPNYSLADATDTFGNLDGFKSRGGKLLTMVGAYDNFIMPRGVIKYYREMASRYGKNPNGPDFAAVQDFYRLFRAPGVGHCGGGIGPQPQNLFDALVNWVENGVAPDTILARGGAVPTRTRPLCPYPTTAIYNGSGSTDDAANFHCGGNLETDATVCKDVLIKYKHENQGAAPIDYSNTGVNRNVCRAFLGAQYYNP